MAYTAQRPWEITENLVIFDWMFYKQLLHGGIKRQPGYNKLLVINLSSGTITTWMKHFLFTACAWPFASYILCRYKIRSFQRLTALSTSILTGQRTPQTGKFLQRRTEEFLEKNPIVRLPPAIKAAWCCQCFFCLTVTMVGTRQSPSTGWSFLSQKKEIFCLCFNALTTTLETHIHSQWVILKLHS